MPNERILNYHICHIVSKCHAIGGASPQLFISSIGKTESMHEFKITVFEEVFDCCFTVIRKLYC